MARCPAHDDGTPSLSVRDTDNGGVLVYCHAGCDQRAVIDRLRALGLWGNATGDASKIVSQRVASAPVKHTDDTARTIAALKLWIASAPATGTTVQTYLQSRGITIAPPSALKFHQGLKHPGGSTFPAMVALVTRGFDNRPIGIHRTFLALGGHGKAAAKPSKMMLGPCRGGVVRLGPITAPLMVGEGIETCLSAMQATGLSAWAALSTSGMATLDLPRDIHHVLILADGDAPGERAALKAAAHWISEGRLVRIAKPPKGSDFNDVLLGTDPDGDAR